MQHRPPGVPFAGSAWLFFATTALYVFSIAGLGLAIGAFARSSVEVGMLVILIDRFWPRLVRAAADRIRV